MKNGLGQAACRGDVVRLGGNSRLAAGLIALGAALLLGLAVYVRPDARGHGTHEQLGLAACGFMERTGYPCPTCGMTTAFALSVRGHFVRAAVAQPAGLAMFWVTVVVLAGSGYACIAGQWPRRWSKPIYGLYVVGALGALALASWGYLCLRVCLGQS